MGKVFEALTPDLREWIMQQKMFFVATAPLAGDGHINCSPKGLDSFRILTSTRVAYQDLTGSGIETVAHLRENNRLLMLFCAFDGKPRIVRLHGYGAVIMPGNAAFNDLASLFPKRKGVRCYIVNDLTRISNSCGFGVPLYEFKGERNQMEDWAEAKGEDGVLQYQLEKNAFSIDGLKGLI